LKDQFLNLRRRQLARRHQLRPVLKNIKFRCSSKLGRFVIETFLEHLSHAT
jgi:hypothetical protein